MVVVGGSASTGSSLLMEMLGRHPQVLAGPETSLFARPQLVAQWDKNHTLLCGQHVRKLHNQGWHRYYGITWDSEFYRLRRDALCNLAKASASYSDFINSLEQLLLDASGRILWVEKTPSNVYVFKQLREHWPGIPLVLTVRNPADAIASMTDRGMSPFYAAALYLMNTSFGLAGKHAGLSVVSYESLVSSPEKTLTSILGGRGLRLEDSLFEYEKKGIRMPGWGFNPGDLPSTGGIGRYHQAIPRVQQEIACLIRHLKIKKSIEIGYTRPAVCSLYELAGLLGYEVPEWSDKDARARVGLQYRKERLARMIGRSPTFRWVFPVYL